MDFTFTPEQDEAASLAARILADRATNERMKAVEADGSRFDRELWGELGSAGLLGLALPEKYDGAGLGLIELCRVLVEAFTRLSNWQAQTANAARKARDLGANRLIILVADTHANRRALAEADAIRDGSFPIRTRAALAALGAGTDPGGDAIVVL